MPFSLIVAARTHMGQVRDHNEDSFLVGTDLSSGLWNHFGPEAFTPGSKGSLFMVADGMGGAQAGEVASEMAVGQVQQQFAMLPEYLESPEDRESFMRHVVTASHEVIAEEASNNWSRRGMGTTAVLGWILEEQLILAWSGDSRAYLLSPEKELLMLSQDHSIVWDMVKEGKLSPEEARVHPQSNIITQSLGDAQYPPQPDSSTVVLSPGSRLLLCSDGLNGMLPDSQIRAILAGEDSTSDTASLLIEAANDAGGEDNITVIVVDIHEAPEKKEAGEKEEEQGSEPSQEPNAGPNTEDAPPPVTQPLMKEAPSPTTKADASGLNPGATEEKKSLFLYLAGIAAVMLLAALVWWLMG